MHVSNYYSCYSSLCNFANQLFINDLTWMQHPPNKEDISKTSYIQRWQRLIVWSGISSFLIYLSRPMNLRAKSGLSLPVLFREIKPKKLDSLS